MQCREFDERMHLLLDERRLPQHDEQLQGHARNCQSCRRLLVDQETLFRGIAGFRARSLPSDFTARVVSQARQEPTVQVAPRPQSRRPWLLAAGVLSSAAAALIALSIAMNRGPAGPGEPPLDRQAHTPAKTNKANRLDKSSNVARSTPPAAKVGGTDTEPRLAASDVESLEQYGQALQSFAAQVPQSVDLDEVEEATPGLRPVRTSFSLAIGTIRRTIPPPRKQEPPRPKKRDSSLLSGAENLPV